MPAASPPINARAAEALVELGSMLRQQRRALKVNAVAAAEAAGISRVTLHRIEKGEPSVTAGAYAAAAAALGLQLQGIPDAAPSSARDATAWIPVSIRLSDYPRLKDLAWQVHGTDELSPREALDIYERNWRHIDVKELSGQEQDLVDALRRALGRTHAL